MNPAVKRATRTFFQAFLGGVGAMLSLQGADILPDLSLLRRIVTGGIVAGVIALVSLAQNALEDKQPSNPKWMLKD